MELLSRLIELFRHFDPQHLCDFIKEYGTWTYLILFVIVFCETGLVVTPFLPGDSLLFAAGAVAAMGSLDATWLFVLLSAAAIVGDTVNYWLGNYIGPRAFGGQFRFIKQEHLDRTHRFYEKYGGKTIILARFIPIIRTFAPFVAGIGTMSYGRFIAYNVIGGMAWVAVFVFFGYRFGSIPWVQDHFSVVVVAIIVISVMPMAVELYRARLRRP